MIRRCLMAVMLLVGLTGCAGEGEGAGTLTLGFLVEGLGEMADSTDEAISVHEAFLHLESVELAMAAGEEAPEDDGHEHSHAETAGDDHDHDHGGAETPPTGEPGAVRAAPGLIDLAHAAEEGKIDLIENAIVLVGEYIALTVQAGPGEIEGEEHELTLFFEGQIDCIGGGNPEELIVEIESDLGGPIILATDAHVVNALASEVAIALHLDELLAGVDVCELATLAGLADGEMIEISHEAAEEAEEDMNEELYEEIHHALESVEVALAGAFHLEDEDHDHE